MPKLFSSLLLAITLIFAVATIVQAQVDANTLLLLKFENSLNGEQGQIPTQATGHTFQAGIQGQGVLLGSPNQLFYSSANNINILEGTFEFWIKPTWNGNDLQTYNIFQWGAGVNSPNEGGAGVWISKDGANNLKIIADRFGSNSGGETSFNTSPWTANQWHYVAFTYSASQSAVKVYIDGVLKNTSTFTGAMPGVVSSTMQIGGFGQGQYVNSVLDNFTISNTPRTPQQIRARFLSGLTVSSLTPTPNTLQMFPTLSQAPPALQAATNIGAITVLPGDVAWSTSNPAVASFDNASGKIVANGVGTATITANLNGTLANITVNVVIPTLTATPNSFQMLPTWWQIPSIRATTDSGTFNVTPNDAAWTTSNASVASFDYVRGKIIAGGPGSATLTAAIYGTSVNITVNVTQPVLPPLVETINPNLANPAANALWEMPVVIIDFIPTVDGVNVDPVETGETGTLVNMRNNLNRIQIQHKFMLEEGSRFRAFGSSSVQPSLGYRVVYKITIFEKMPEGILDPGGNGSYFPDYDQILTRVNAQNFVNNLGVKEFWIGMYHFGHISPVESNMSSPTTGDISNSYRHNDLPIFNKTYVVYGINFGRTAAEATHNHGHQLEAIHRFTNQRQDGNTQLFMQKFCGFAANGTWQRGRAGDTHHPPNALTDYDYSNTTPFASDIADWNPNGGTTQPVALSTWRGINYPFPDGVNPPSDDSWWYVYWFQSMPGRGNTILYNANRMTNWWQFTGDWDAAYRAGVGLYEPASCSYGLSGAAQAFPANGGTGSVTVTAATGCKWFASSNGMWVPLTTGDIGNGNGTVNFTVAANTSGVPRTTKLIVAGQPFTVTQAGRATPFDLDGDGKTDLSIFRPNGTSGSEWWWLKSSTGGNAALQFGTATDRLAPVDFTGDGKTDVAFWRPSTGQWFVLRSEDFSFYAFPFGATGDVPVPGDYDGDGKADAAVFRESSLTWFISKSSGGTDIVGFGAAGDKPVNADYDGDGKVDIAIYRPNGANGSEWWIRRSSNGLVFATQFGQPTDKAVAGDYTGDGKADIAYWTPSSGNWFVLRSEDFSYYAFPFGASTDVPVPGDYDGDGKLDAAVFRASTSTWFANRSTAGVLIQQFGIAGDLPVPGAFVR